MDPHIPFVTQIEEEEDLTMVVRPPPMQVNNSVGATSKPKPVPPQVTNLPKNTNLFPIFMPNKPQPKRPSKLVHVKAFTKKNGTYVPAHSRVVKVDQPSKFCKKSKSASKQPPVTSSWKKLDGPYTKSMFVGVDQKTKATAFSSRINDILARNRMPFAQSVKKHLDSDKK